LFLRDAVNADAIEPIAPVDQRKKLDLKRT